MLQVAKLSAALLFLSAFEIWIGKRTLQTAGFQTRARYISERTEWDYRQYARALAKFFGALRLEDIHSGHFHEYHRARAVCDGPWDLPAGPNRIRKEVGMLKTIMQAAGAWTKELEENFEPLQAVENDIPRALTPEQQDTFLRTAASRVEWQVVYWYSVLGLQTTAATNEMRGISLLDMNLQQRVVLIRDAKNKYRTRTIPLETDEVIWCCERLIERAYSLGSDAPHHKLFPFRVKRGHFDPCKAMTESGIKKLWDEVRREAGVPWFCEYGLRHTGCTRMAEAGVPIPVIMSYTGHMSRKMLQHYTSISLMAKRRWAAVVWSPDMAAKRPVARETTLMQKIS